VWNLNWNLEFCCGRAVADVESLDRVGFTQAKTFDRAMLTLSSEQGCDRRRSQEQAIARNEPIKMFEGF